MRATLGRSIKGVTGEAIRRRDIRVQSKVSGTPVTSIQFRMGNKFYRQDMTDVNLPDATTDVVVKLPGTKAVAGY